MGNRPDNTITCPDCRRFVGRVPFAVLVTGCCDVAPLPDPECRDGEHGIEGYHQCASCKRFVRWEVVERRQTPRPAKISLADAA